ncbi:uncharacterized protein LOC143035357 [Oratosquilla oratoria]|uniref:uncharacterized protein LOC143035357 n=1 Tax=Oratosquilla oratoria TaxID=337810 RepID=UPI003F766012
MESHVYTFTTNSTQSSSQNADPSTMKEAKVEEQEEMQLPYSKTEYPGPDGEVEDEYEDEYSSSHKKLRRSSKMQGKAKIQGLGFQRRQKRKITRSKRRLGSYDPPPVEVLLQEINEKIDFSNVLTMIQGTPIIKLHSRNRLYLQCTRTDGSVIKRHFACNDLGVEDPQALQTIQNFVNSEKAIAWLDTARKKELSFKPIEGLVIGTPVLAKGSKSTLRLKCMLKSGKVISKIFPCSYLGSKDNNARQMIQEFINSPSCKSWLQEGNWIKVAEVKTGVSAKRYISNEIPFDVNQEVFCTKNIVEIIRDEDCLESSTVTSKWGSTHRADDHFQLKEDVEKIGDKVVVTMYLYCASLSDQCQTQCGQFIKDVTLTSDKVFTCCGLKKETNHICINCHTDNAKQWHNNGDGTHLCYTCYNYYLKHKVHRTPKLSGIHKSRIHHPHTTCQWKMKFELRSLDMTTWNVYQHSSNNKNHNINSSGKIRPTLEMKDRWDKMRVYNKLTPKKIFSTETRCGYDNNSGLKKPITMNTIKRRTRTIKKHELARSNAVPQSEVPLISAADIGWDTEIILDDTFTNNCQYQQGDPRLKGQAPQSNNIPQPPKHRKRDDILHGLPILCTVCIELGFPPEQIFRHSKLSIINKHMREVHFGYACYTCFMERGLNTKFSPSELVQHQEIHNAVFGLQTQQVHHGP